MGRSARAPINTGHRPSRAWSASASCAHRSSRQCLFAQVVAGNTFHPFELYTAAMLAYFLLCFPVARGVDRIYRRFAHLGSS